MYHGKYVINHYPNEEFPWYVQHVHCLDYGRFSTEEAAKEHLKFVEEEEKRNDIPY